jgi:MscS family membrane protein
MPDGLAQQSTAFFAAITQFFEQKIIALGITNLILAAAVLVFFIVTRKLFSQRLLSKMAEMAGRTSTDLDDMIVKALQKPLQFAPLILGFFLFFELLDLSPKTDDFLHQVFATLVIFNVFAIAYHLVDPIFASLTDLQKFLGHSLADWIGKTLKLFLLVFGATIALEIWGINVAHILTGFGLLGVAVALGAQDLFKNLIAGILILAERRFANGDWIKVDGVIEGTVERIGFRSTFIRRFDKSPVFIPNTKLSDNAVTNFSRMTNRRIYWVIGLRYDTDVATLRQVRDRIEAYISQHPDFVQPPEGTLIVRFDTFSDSALDLMIYCFTRTTAWTTWLEIREQLAYEIKEIVASSGTDFAFPSQSIYIEKTDGAAALSATDLQAKEMPPH